MAAAGLIDPTKTGNYPVILGDGLLGKTSNEIFTAIRYNHKPAHSSASAPSSARLKPSTPGKTSSYDLAYADDDGKYGYTGTRNTDEGQYVLYFDQDRQAFVLDKVDSTFNMNLTRLPDNADPDSLRKLHPPIELASRPAPAPPKTSKSAPAAKPNVEKTEKVDKAEKPAAKPTAKPATKPATKPVTKPAAKPATKPATKPAAKPAAKPRPKPPVQKKKPVPKAPPKSINLSLPVPVPQQEKEPEKEEKKRRSMDEEEEEYDDDDGGLLIEYPDGDPRNNRQPTDFSPAFPSVRRFDDFMNQRESEGDDADGEDDDEDIDFKLPSPVNNQSHPPQHEYAHQDQHEEDDLGADLEDDLEKEMEIAFEDLENSNEGTPHDGGDESEISEED